MLVQACPVLRHGEGAGASGVCHSEEQGDEESQALRDCCVCILTNEAHSLYTESENRGSIDLSAEWSEVLDSSLRSERQEGARRLSF